MVHHLGSIARYGYIFKSSWGNGLAVRRSQSSGFSLVTLVEGSFREATGSWRHTAGFVLP